MGVSEEDRAVLSSLFAIVSTDSDVAVLRPQQFLEVQQLVM